MGQARTVHSEIYRIQDTGYEYTTGQRRVVLVGWPLSVCIAGTHRTVSVSRTGVYPLQKSSNTLLLNNDLSKR